MTVTVDGVVDIPEADSLFQRVGAPSGAQPQAPPDNVLILPAVTWHQLFDPLPAARPDLVREQLHARLDHHLVGDPTAAYSTVTGRARNLEVRLAGAGLVGDNLGAALAAARTDAHARAVPLPSAPRRSWRLLTPPWRVRSQAAAEQALPALRDDPQLVSWERPRRYRLTGSALGRRGVTVGRAFGTVRFATTAATLARRRSIAIAVGRSHSARRDARETTAADARAHRPGR